MEFQIKGAVPRDVIIIGVGLHSCSVNLVVGAPSLICDIDCQPVGESVYQIDFPLCRIKCHSIQAGHLSGNIVIVINYVNAGNRYRITFSIYRTQLGIDKTIALACTVYHLLSLLSGDLTSRHAGLSTTDGLIILIYCFNRDVYILCFSIVKIDTFSSMSSDILIGVAVEARTILTPCCIIEVVSSAVRLHLHQTIASS